MSFREDDLNMRRRELASAIARQRGELANAYRGLAKPLQYAETGLKGLAFIRQNPWVFSVVPAAFTVTSSLVALARGGKSTEKRARRSRHREEEQEVERIARKAPKSMSGHVLKWGGRGWKMFRLYRKLRHYIS